MDDQARCLEEAISIVQEQAFYMKRAIDNDNLRETLKYASNLIAELRTSLLLPKSYHDLYMQVFQEMQYLATFFSDKTRHKRKMTELYGSVQNAGSILPRLYLLATIGGSYIKSREVPAKEVLTDLSELCKGVQDPMRGLFLRYFLSQMVKDKLPDTGSDYEKEGGGDIGDAFDFMFANLVESNRFWVRMQFERPTEDRGRHERHEQQRNDLRVLVGANLVRLSQLDGMTVKFYAEVALPKILEHVLAVKDVTSQQYLFELILQVFPTSYHIHTLESIFLAISNTMFAVDVRGIMMALIKRLLASLKNDDSELPDGMSMVDFLALFCSRMQAACERRLESAALDLKMCLEMHDDFISFARALSPDHLAQIDNALSSILAVLQRYVSLNGSDASRLDNIASGKVLEFFEYALRPLALDILKLSHYHPVLNLLNFRTRRRVAVSIVECVVSEDIALDSSDVVSKLFNILTPLVNDEDDTPVTEGMGGDDSSRDQLEVCKLLYQIRVEELGQQFELLDIASEFFCQGNATRQIHMLPPIVNVAMAFLAKFRHGELAPNSIVLVKKTCQLIHKTITALVQRAPDIALQLWLSTAVVIDGLHKDSQESFEAACYEFMTQGMLCFEEHISDSKRQYEAIFQLVGTLSILTCLEEDNRETISGKIISYAARLLIKPLQCRAIAACAQMFWNDSQRDGKKVLECLQKCLKICAGIMQQDARHVGLWVEMLDTYILYFEKDCQEVTIKFIESLVNLCLEHIAFAGSTDDCTSESEKAARHLKDSIRYITRVKKDGSRQVTRFDGFSDEDLLRKVAEL